jgi:hypothetical protein
VVADLFRQQKYITLLIFTIMLPAQNGPELTERKDGKRYSVIPERKHRNSQQDLRKYGNSKRGKNTV